MDASLALFTLRFIETKVREKTPGDKDRSPQDRAPGEVPRGLCWGPDRGGGCGVMVLMLWCW